MKSRSLSIQQNEVIHYLHNLVWHRITQDDIYLKEIENLISTEFHEWIYYIKYEFLEYDDSLIQAVIYLNGKHYEYSEAPQICNGSIWVNEIDDSEVQKKIIELRGEIYEGFEIYNAPAPLDESVIKKLDASSDEYYDLPF